MSCYAVHILYKLKFILVEVVNEVKVKDYPNYNL